MFEKGMWNCGSKRGRIQEFHSCKLITDNTSTCCYGYDKVSGWTDGWKDGRMDGWMGGWMDGWMDGWMEGRMKGRIDGWMDGWMLKVF